MNKERENKLKNKATDQSKLLKSCKKELVRQTSRAEKWRKESLLQREEIKSKCLIIKHLKSKKELNLATQIAIELDKDKVAVGYKYELSVIKLCVKLYKLGLSLRNVCAVLALISCYLGSEFKVPSHVTVSIWVQKVGLHLQQTGLEKFKKSTEKWCLIIDESYSLAKSQLLLILAVRLSTLESGSLKMDDVVPLFIGSQSVWTGIEIAACITEITKDSEGRIAYVTSDCGRPLVCAYKSIALDQVPDWSHYAANILENIYVQNADFKLFNEQMSIFKRKRHQSSYAYYAPPSLSVKIRFMNYLPFIDWANTMLENEKKIPTDLKSELYFLQELKVFLCELSDLFYSADEIGKIVKKEGINELSHAKAQHKLAVLAKKYANNQNVASFIKKVEDYFEHTLVIYKKYIEKQDKSVPFFDGLIASSDIIECLFGKLKSRTSNNPKRGFSAICLLIPLFCQDFSHKQALEAMINVNMEKLENWKNEKLCNRKYKSFKNIFKQKKGKVYSSV